jgi:hypothetical protein
MRIANSGVRPRRRLELDEDTLAGVVPVPCLIALMTDSRMATLTQWSESSSRPMPAPGDR